MDIVAILQALLGMSPLAIIGLLGTIIFMMVKQGKWSTEKSVKEIQNNHLHELPEIAETLRRIEQKIGEDFSYIKAKLNGR